MSNMLMLGLWGYILKVPPFLWKKQIAQGKKRFEKVHGSLTEDMRNIHHFVVKELPSTGKPLSPGIISEKLGLSPDRVQKTLDYLERSMTFLYRNADGDVNWAYPVTVDKTPHRLTFSTGESVYAA